MSLVLIIIALILAVGSACRRLDRSWLAPSAFFSLLWAPYIAVSSAFVSQPSEMVGGVAWILLSCVCFGAGTFGGTILDTRNKGLVVKSPHVRSVRLIVFISLSVCLAEIAYLFTSRSMSLTSGLSFSGMASVSALNRVEFGYGDRSQSRLEWLVFAISYLGTLFGGLLSYISTRTSDRVAGVLTLLLLTYVGMLYGSRMGVLFGSGYWLASFIAARVHSNGQLGVSDSKFLLRVGMTTFGAMVGLSIVVLLVRYTFLADDRNLAREISETFIFVPAFCIWFNEEGLASQELLWGYRSFWRLYEVFGVSHSDIEHAIPVERTSSNIFTAFRGVIEDFGQIGSCIWFFVWGVLGRVSYSSVRKGRAASIPLLVTVYAYMLVGTCFSVFTYNAPLAALIVFFLYFAVSGLRDSSVRTSPLSISPPSPRL